MAEQTLPCSLLARAPDRPSRDRREGPALGLSASMLVDPTGRALLGRALAAHDRRLAEILPVLVDRHDLACPTCTSAACCYEVVVARRLEAEIGIEAGYAAKLDLAARARAWAERARQAGLDGPDPDHSAYFAARIPCVFLDAVARQCAIYQARPLACRFHMVRGEPTTCALPHGERPDMRVVHLESRRLAEALLPVGEATGNLSALVVAHVQRAA